MQQNYYIFTKDELNLTINRMPVWFKEVSKTGDENKGTISLHSQNEYDEVWGANAKLEISWEKKGRTEYFHAKQVQASIDMFNAIKVVVTEKERTWLMSHEFTYWFGNRNKMVRKRYYQENIIHGVFYCDMTERQIDISAYIIRPHYEGFKPFILECFNSIICH